MPDFHQNGVIATLHNFNTKKIEQIEKDLLSFSKTYPMTLILPSLYSELEKPALTYICLLYTSPSPRDLSTSRMPSSA